MSEQARLLDRLAAVECPAFQTRRQAREAGPIVLARGEGSYVWDADGKRYLDLAAGFGSVLLGHGHPALRRALQTQSERLMNGLGDVYASDTKLALLEALAAMHPRADAQVLLAQSGGDAITAAMKTATLATGRSGFVAFDGAYHGLGYAPLAACGYNAGFREPFSAQLARGVRFAPYPGVRGATARASLEMVADLLDDDVAAVIVEPVLGRGGCIMPPDGWLAGLAALCAERGTLLIADEIWTGLGRTGALLRTRALGVEPDILCLGKGLGGGLSVSACIASASVMAGWKKAATVHTSTHAGAPVPCATALATLATLDREGLVARAAAVGDEARRALTQRLGDRAAVRGCGMMIGIELESAAAARHVGSELMKRGYLVIGGGVAGDALTITPALNIPLTALLEFGEALGEALS